MKYLYFYLAFINLLAIVVTVYDKDAAVHGRWRVRERTLILVSVLGGALGMYITMLVIRHKTRKPLFMIGIPVFGILELTVICLVVRYGFKVF